MPDGTGPPEASSPDHPLTRVIDRLAHLLPAQGPISIFIHHNTLHAFEHLPFEEAVEHAAERLGREPFLAESRYRDKLASGRILARDVEALLVEQLGASGAEDVAGVGSRLDLWRAVVLHGIPAATGRELSWILEETAALSRFRTDVPASARSASAALRELDDRAGEERRAVHRLWNACVEAVGRAGESPRSRDATLRFAIATGCWPCTASTPMPGSIRRSFDSWRAISIRASRTGPCPSRNRGIHGCFLEIYRTSLAAQCGHWARTLPRLVADDRAAGRSALDSIAHSLAQLGVADDECADYLSAELLALRGWAGIVRQIEERPDRVPARDLTVTLARIPRGPPAVRTGGARRRRRDNSPSTARCRSCAPGCGISSPSPPAPTALERAWPLFHVAQLCGLDASIVEQWTAAARGGARVRAATSSTACAGAGSCTRRSSERFVIACTTRSCSTRRSSFPSRRRSRRSSASTSGRNRFAAIWRKSSRPARRSARPDSSTWRCITRA